MTHLTSIQPHTNPRTNKARTHSSSYVPVWMVSMLTPKSSPASSTLRLWVPRVCVCVCVCVRVRVCACVFVNVCLYHTCVRLQAISYACLYWKSTEVMDTHTQEHTQTSTHPHLPPTPPTHTCKQASTHKHIQSQGNTPDQKPLQNSLSPAE